MNRSDLDSLLRRLGILNDEGDLEVLEDLGNTKVYGLVSGESAKAFNASSHVEITELLTSIRSSSYSENLVSYKDGMIALRLVKRNTINVVVFSKSEAPEYTYRIVTGILGSYEFSETGMNNIITN